MADNVDFEKLAALRAKLSAANNSQNNAQEMREQMPPMQTVPPVQSAPAPPPPPQSAPQQKSATAALRERMQNSTATGNQTVMEQGGSYQGSNAEPVQQTETPQPAQTKGSGLAGIFENKTLVIAIAAIVIVGIVIILIMAKSKKGNTEEGDDSGQVEIIDEPEDIDWIIPDQGTASMPVIYSQEEVEKLREVGYTGYEIEQFSNDREDFNRLVEEAETKRDLWLRENIAPLYDSASEEYKAYINQTWLSLSKRKDVDNWDEIAGTYELRKNLDYEKIDVYGEQLFIKVYLDDDEHKKFFFVCVTPEQYAKLKNRGNVIVTYTYETRYVYKTDSSKFEDTKNIWIIDAELEIIE